MKRWRFTMAAGTALVLATAATAALRTWRAAETPVEIISNDGAYRVTYERPNGGALPLNEPFTLTVSVYRRDGAARQTDVALTVDASMPEHMHGMNVRPTVTANEDGTFTAEGMLLHMPGRWELYFDVRHGGVTERAQDELTLE